ncbi:MAG: hypothetical protein FWB85_08690 [Chitinispirillia bacterium]|nr:hypothetical protein [Chitinispirillia bacterium]MCL2242387.1 hypothetical protein [Chitinispirillia bacterium]
MTVNTAKNVLPSGAARDYYAFPDSWSESALMVSEPSPEYSSRKHDGWGNPIASDREVKAAAAEIFTKYRGAFERLADM